MSTADTYTKEQKEFLITNAPTLQYSVLTKLFNEKFNENKTQKQIRKWCYYHNITALSSRNMTEEQVQFIMEHYHCMPRKELTELFNEKLEKVSIVSPFYCDHGNRISIGKNVTINKGCTIMSVGKVIIEDDILIGPDVKIVTVNHDLKDRHNTCHFKPVILKRNAWICIGAVICPGVTVGENAVVGAGAVVTKDVPDNAIVGGNPAKVIKYID